MGEKSLYLNADVLSKAVPCAISILDLLKQKFREIPRNLNVGQKKSVQDHLKMLKISYKLKGQERIKQFHKLALSAKEQTFNLDGKQTTIEKYFKTKHGTTLKYPDLPLIQVLPADKQIFLPMEFCSIPPGQLNQKKCSDKCAQTMIKETAKPTDERKAMIKDFSNTYPLNNDVKAFGVDISKEFEKVMARIIDKPNIVFKNSKEIPKDNDGTWRDGVFVKNMEPVKFAIINLDEVSGQMLHKLKDEILNMAHKKQMNMTGDIFGSKNISTMVNEEVENYLRQEFSKIQTSGFNLVIIINNDRNDCYPIIKTISETQIGIMTQVLKKKTFTDNRTGDYRCSYTTMNNVFLKINAMFNGTNHTIDGGAYNAIVKLPVMFIGADVTHPPSEQKGVEPSVAAVCASYDQLGSKYHPVWRLQKGGIDLIADFENIMVEQFEFYQKKNQRLPSKIIYYRDGVGESQFEKFLGPETDSLRRACDRVYPQGVGKPQITLIVVNKRHHMRAFPMTPKEGDGTKFNNILPGTVIDKDIVHAKYNQFFLASHSALQGCSKPTKYTVLLDESKIPPDVMQTLTYCLCHMYVRCNRSVSLPNCTYYAHLMAFRAKRYIYEGVNLDNLDEEFKARSLKDEIVNGHPMFFV